MRMADGKPDKRLHLRIWGSVFNANVFSVLAVHIRLFFSGKFCIRLCFRLENGCAALKVQSPQTSGAI